MRTLALLLLVGSVLASPLLEDGSPIHMPISDEFEEVAAPILYELVEKRGNNFQPWTGKRNYEPWRGKRSSGHTDQGEQAIVGQPQPRFYSQNGKFSKGYQPWLGRRKKDDETHDYMWSRLKKNQSYQWSRIRRNQYNWGRL